ncbi:hypothetical protein LTR56_021795 [Elasticomyces elasticus]|nr:hypothetical protein LTR56_021795 [Elasticomyces elasticus]KAK3630551.1 hypothetical protein LTR22_021467 [Elasticomyces elasticus]KAK4909064.1 hypothetical protein LTR49_022104 [Elasticomyces elasticus]KAK5748471.1 hypothetical protein LTS12_021490 [Elasticomyces elasticus]
MPRLLKPGRLWAICCTVEVPAEVKDRFLQLNKDFILEPGHEQQLLVFVDSTAETYSTESRVGENTASSSTSEFIGKGPDECSLLLQQLVRAGSDIDYEDFVIFDARSLQDDTVLVVGKEALTEDEEAECASVRMIFEMVYCSLLAYLAGSDTSIEEDYEKSQMFADGVLRSPYVCSCGVEH